MSAPVGIAAARDDSRSEGRAPPATNLPSGLSDFLGREAELSELERVLVQARLVTLTGAPGIGKSRLGLELARTVAARHPDGAWLVALAPLGDGALVPAAVAATLGLAEEPGRDFTDTLVARLKGRRLVLLLDNCEHLVEACTALSGALLDGCPEITIIATSREPLEASGEVLCQVPALALPDSADLESAAASEAVRLFVERAAAVQPGFAINGYVAPAVVEICRRLDGIPLAIELAAARVELLTPPEIARGLDDRFGLLRAAGRSATVHHRTLQAALDWSYELLPADECGLLRRLSVFAGGFGLDAAQSICAWDQVEREAVAELLSRLVARSLVVSEHTPDTEGARFRLLETVRAYARTKMDQAGETALVREAHARHYLALAERAEPELTGPDQERWLEVLEAERPNLRTALEWSLGRGHDELALRLAGALVLLWRVRCHFGEGRKLLEAALAASNGDTAGEGDPAPLRAKALWGLGFMALMADDTESAIPPLEAGLRIFSELDDRQGRARALLLLGNCRQLRRTTTGPTSLSLLEQSAALAREAGDPWCLAHALGIAGLEHCVRDELGAARPLFEECLAVARAAQDKQGLRLGLLGLGAVAAGQGDSASGEPLLTEAIAVAGELGEDYTRARALQDLSLLALARGAYARARVLLDEALALVRDVAPAKLVPPLVLRARVARFEGEAAEASRLLDEALHLALAGPGASRPAQVVRELGELARESGDLQDARSLLEEALETARAGGDRRSSAQALYGLGELARVDGKVPAAAALHGEALGLRHGIGDGPGVADSLEALAGVSLAAGHPGRAAEVHAAAAALRDAHSYARSPGVKERLDADQGLLRGALPAEELKRALGRGASLALDAAVARALNGKAPRGRASDGWPSLTERERQVAALVAEGLTNAQIAERLFISFGSVKDHLSHVFAKLGIARRAELAREVSLRERESDRV